MNVLDSKKERFCSFYASEYHLGMIILPYINKSINNHKEIIVFTEENLQEKMEKIYNEMKIKDIEKNELEKIDFNNNDLKKFKEIKKEIEKDKEVFIIGRKQYIEHIRMNLSILMSSLDNIQFIDCYQLNEIYKEMINLANPYKKILTTNIK